MIKNISPEFNGGQSVKFYIYMKILYLRFKRYLILKYILDYNLK